VSDRPADRGLTVTIESVDRSQVRQGQEQLRKPISGFFGMQGVARDGAQHQSAWSLRGIKPE
jgi:hypothetical protein